MTFEDLYKREIDQKEKLNSELSLPLGLLVAVGGLLGAMLQSAWFEFGILSACFYLAALASAGFFTATMYFLVRSYYGHTYRGMPFALQLMDYRDKLRKWHSTYGTGPDAGDREWEQYLEDAYADAADFNGNVNLIKSQYLFRARGAVVGCAISTVLTFVPFGIHKAVSPSPPQRIEIVNPDINKQGKLITEEDKTMPPQTKPAALPPPKPLPPPFRVLKEGEIPKKK